MGSKKKTYYNNTTGEVVRLQPARARNSSDDICKFLTMHIVPGDPESEYYVLTNREGLGAGVRKAK